MTVSAVDVVVRSGVDSGDLDLSGVRIRKMPDLMQRIVGRSASAMTLGDTIYVHRDKYDRLIRGELRSLLAHELVHVGQFRKMGNVVFMARYLRDYVANRLIGLDHKVAYRAISVEAEAYDVSDRLHEDVV